MFSAVNGLWIPCTESLSRWNTHLGSEEYERDARLFLNSTLKVRSQVEKLLNSIWDKAKANLISMARLLKLQRKE